MSRSSDSAAPRRGFTLLEVIVALAILSIAMATFLRLFSTGLRAVDIAEHQAVAAMHAESILAEIGVSEPLAEGLRQGEFERGYWWRAEVRPYADTGPVDARPGSVTAFVVAVTVGWDRDRKAGFTLETIRLTRVEQ